MASEQIGILTIIAIFGLFIWHFISYHRKPPLWQTIALIFFLIGWLCLYLSPGHHARASLDTFKGVYMSLHQLLELSFVDKLKRIYITMNKFKSAVAVLFFVFIWIAFYVKIIKNTIKLKLAWHIILSFMGAIIIIALGCSIAIIDYAIILALLFALSRVDSSYKIILVLFLLWLLCAFITIQFPALPTRARLGDSLILLSACCLLLVPYLENKKIFIATLSLSAIFAIFVLYSYIEYRLKWNTMVEYISTQKALGNTHIEVEDIFHSPYWNFKGWGNPGDNPNEWPNPSYAKYFGIESFKVKKDK